VQAGSEETTINAIKKLKNLYVKYFEKYCHAPLNRVGYDLDDGQNGSGIDRQPIKKYT
jgi:hypothetical protein